MTQMPEWAMQLIQMAIGSVAITGGIGWWFKTRRDDRLAEMNRLMQERKDAIERAEKYSEKLESLLRDSLAAALENKAQIAERIAMDKQMASITTSMVAALERAERRRI